MAEKEKPQKSGAEEKEKPQAPENKGPAAKELTRNELEALREELQRRFHR